MEAQVGGCTGVSRGHLLEPRRGLGFPWATGGILGRNKGAFYEGDGWAGARSRVRRWQQGGQREEEMGEQRRPERGTGSVCPSEGWPGEAGEAFPQTE